MEKGNIFKIQEHEIYYELKGEGIPILMLHGWSVDHHLMSGCMEPVMEESKYKFQRIYFDFPGMGKSKVGSGIKNSDDMLQVIEAFIDEVIKDKKFILAGESYGGLLSRGLIKKRSEQILGLLLICPLYIPGYRLGTVVPYMVLKRDEDLLKELSDKERSYFEGISIIQTRPVWERFKSDIIVGLESYDTDFLHNVLDGAFSYEVDPPERPFDKPTLILVGRQDTEVGYADQFKLMEYYTRASYVVLDAAGHNLQIEQPELFAATVKEWLNRVVEVL